MNHEKNEENEEGQLFRSSGKKFYRVRITANPADPETVNITEGLLSKAEVFRCESSTEEGVSVWSLILDEEYIDDALRGIAVVESPDYAIFADNEGKMFMVADQEVCQLAGYAEETAMCREGEDLIQFDFEVSRVIGCQMSIELQALIAEHPDEDEILLAEVHDRAWSKADIYRWDEEDVRDAVREAFKELLEEKDLEKGEEEQS